jgi:MFS family permease
MAVLSLHLLRKPNKDNVVPGLVWPAATRALRPVHLAIVAAMTSSKLRGKVFGIQAALRAIGLFAGSTVGSRIIDTFDWRWMLWVNMPVGIIVTVIAWFIAVETNTTRFGSVDILGPRAALSLEKFDEHAFLSQPRSSRLF